MGQFGYKQGTTTIALKLDGYFVWDTSVIKAENKYWMFSSRWKEELGFGWNWCFNSQIILSVSDKPEGPYNFVKVIFERRGREYFDGMNTHNTCIKYYKGKYYLYYMGCTYKCEIPKHMNEINMDMVYEAWYNKRIGLAISDKIDGDYIRRDEPLLKPRPLPNWDSSITTNPSVIIHPDGKTIMLYKSRIWKDKMIDDPMRIGITTSDNPEGPFARACDKPIFSIAGEDISVEDPFVWFDKNRNIYCALIKDCTGDIAGMYGNLFYAESPDCMNFEITQKCAIQREVTWEDGHHSLQCNLERPCLLFDESGKATHLFAASGNGKSPYAFEGLTYIVCLKLEAI